MVPALLEQPARGKPDRSASHPAALVRRREKYVEARMAALGIVRFVVADPARGRAVDLDHERPAFVEQTRALILEILERTPPLPHTW